MIKETSDPLKSPARLTLPLRAKGHSSLAGGLYFTWPERIVERGQPEPARRRLVNTVDRQPKEIIPEMWNPTTTSAPTHEQRLPGRYRTIDSLFRNAILS